MCWEREAVALPDRCVLGEGGCMHMYARECAWNVCVCVCECVSGSVGGM